MLRLRVCLCVFGEEVEYDNDEHDRADDNSGDGQIQSNATFDLGAVPVPAGRAARPA